MAALARPLSALVRVSATFGPFHEILPCHIGHVFSYFRQPFLCAFGREGMEKNWGFSAENNGDTGRFPAGANH